MSGLYISEYMNTIKKNGCVQREWVCVGVRKGMKVEEIEKSDGKYDEEIKVKKNVRGEK